MNDAPAAEADCDYEDEYAEWNGHSCEEVAEGDDLPEYQEEEVSGVVGSASNAHQGTDRMVPVHTPLSALHLQQVPGQWYHQ